MMTHCSSAAHTWADPSAILRAGGGGVPVLCAVLLLCSTIGCTSSGTDAVRAQDASTADPVRCESPPANDELRGVWLTNVDSKVLDSRARIEEAMAFLADHNVNVVFPVVWNDATTLYPSAVMDTLTGQRIDPQYEGRDPLAELVAAAHEEGLAVMPWFEFGFSASHKADGGPILDKYPQWAARDTSGALVTKNGFDWMNGYHPAVRGFVLDLILEVVRTYDIDGIQGDDRLPANPVEGGYSDVTKQLYRSEHDGQDPPADPRDADWKAWRAEKLSDFAVRVYDEVKAVDSSLVVSWAPSPYPFGYNEYLQDWPAWINRGAADLVHPQVYRRDVASYENFLQEQQPEAAGWAPDKIDGFYPGVLMQVSDYTMSPRALKRVINVNREHGHAGEVYFFYEGLRANDGALADVLKSCYETPATLPFDPATAK